MNPIKVDFSKAKPVWLAKMQNEMNCTVIFKAFFDYHSGAAMLRITGYTNYKVLVNNKFAGFGPARAGHGYYRVDELHIGKYIKQGQNIIAIEVCGYNTNSYAYPNQPSFLQAEVLLDDVVIAYTDMTKSVFKAKKSPYKYIKTQRYSFQRPFVEAYRLDETYHDYFTSEINTPDPLELCDNKNTISRNVLLYEYPISEAKVIKCGTFTVEPLDRSYKIDMWGVMPDIKMFKGYREDELQVHPYKLAEFTKTTSVENKDSVPLLSANQFTIYQFDCERTGFIGIKLIARSDAIITITFDEILLNDDVSYKRMNCCNVLYFELKAGKYCFESAEAYSMKYCKIAVYNGEITVDHLFIRQHINTDTYRASFVSSSEKLNRIYRAAEETFKQNAVDIYMDCPGRERAGWLCDSFFTSRVEMDLTGKSLIEHNFIQNFLLPESFKYIPEGMIPCCYPSDHGDGTHITNWALWFILELKEYLIRTSDDAMIAMAKKRVYNLLDYICRFENSDGLIEDMSGWIFIEWSRANDFTDGVNYPSNMLYSAALKTIGQLYNDPAQIEKADRIKEAVLKQSYNGRFFEDNRIRNEGKLIATGNISECCQYYAFFLGIATPQTHPELFNRLVNEFGPFRDADTVYPEVFKSNAFIGNFLRLEMLSAYGYSAKIVDEIEAFFDYMALTTGTLWENVDTSASCNHGFASHVIHLIFRDILGIKNIDNVSRKVTCQKTVSGINYAKCVIPLWDGQITVSVENDKHHFTVPQNYKAITVDR